MKLTRAQAKKRQKLLRRIRDLFWYIDQELDRLDDLVAYGPEATRDEVGFARSPQRDCRTARVVPAH